MKICSILAVALFCIALGSAGVKADDWQSREYQQGPREYQQSPQEQQNQQACMNDALALCAEFVPDRDRVAACLLSNRRRVSAACRMVLMHWHG